MLFRCKYKMLSISTAFFLALLSGSFAEGGDRGAGTIPPVPISTEATRLLEFIETEVDAYNAQLKSGEIEFSVTMHHKRSSGHNTFLAALLEYGRNRLIPPKEKAPAYDVTGVWHITYQFEGNTEFFDVKAHTKYDIKGNVIVTRMEDGHLRHGIWRKTHHQFLRHGRQTLYIRDGATWTLYDKWARSQSLLLPTVFNVFNERFNPRWWGWPPHGEPFEKFIHPYKTIDVKTVEIDGIPHCYLQLDDSLKKDGSLRYATSTLEIWMHPRKNFNVIRIKKYKQSLERVPHEGSFWPPTLPGEELAIGVRCDSKTYQLAEYEPGVWFPKTVTESHGGAGKVLSDLSPDTPVSKYAAIINAAHLLEWYRSAHQNVPWVKRVMKVHRAVFNIPIEMSPHFISR